ncbi:dinuclear metal center YbgI/SA1388 family protein [Streptacidiphilus sp. MAP12-20]|uniref:Nif3-like dinuclear metal center hexameric protein n=1 Tax=Streptacidiphilus sp. MAP12-20 TaxID=3156299 RepID=UPI003517C273
MPKLSDVRRALDELYPPAWAESWDAVGLVCGDPEARVSRVLFAVDPVQAVVDEAARFGAQLVVTHHPLYLRGTTTVAADTFKGKVVHTLIRQGIGLMVAHTNADHADPGVSDALAEAIGLRITGPLIPDPTDPAGRRGTGRIGELMEPVRLETFAAAVAAGLPATAQGVRAAGDPDQLIRRVAVCGGSGDSFFAAVREAGVDAYVTADLRHHPASEAREATSDGKPALVDAAHWATEWPWLRSAESALLAVSEKHGWDLTTRVSTLVTDPWTTHAPMPFADLTSSTDLTSSADLTASAHPTAFDQPTA